MPHQCLKCGKVFPSGSQEILKGCSNCGGKKFFYTEQPVSDKEREHLIEQANKDIKVLIREILSQTKQERYDFQDSEGEVVTGVGPGDAKDWVKISPGKKGKIKGKEKVKDKDLKGKVKDDEITSEIETPEEHKLPTVKEILEELKESVPDEELKEQKKEGAKKRSKEKRKKIGKIKRKRKLKPKKKGRGPKPEIITVSEPGVYNIKLEKLMKGFPIIIYRDGSYLVHLPSVFESIERKKKD